MRLDVTRQSCHASDMLRVLVLLVSLAPLWVVGCLDGGTKPRFNSDTNPNANSAPISLRTNFKIDENVRTRRTLFVNELLDGGRKIISTQEEAFINKVKRVDRFGTPTQILRAYERYVVRVKQAGGEEKETRSALEGCEFELTQLSDSVGVRLTSGEAKPTDYQKLIINGFDAALLPVNEVRLGDRWEIDANEIPSLVGLLRSAGLSVERNDLSAEFYDLRGDDAHIAINWKVTGTIKLTSPIVFRLKGELIVDTANKIVKEVTLEGGKTNSRGQALQQMKIHVLREKVESWYK